MIVTAELQVNPRKSRKPPEIKAKAANATYAHTAVRLMRRSTSAGVSRSYHCGSSGGVSITLRDRHFEESPSSAFGTFSPEPGGEGSEGPSVTPAILKRLTNAAMTPNPAKIADSHGHVPNSLS